jgi:HD-GYP domain-containing protein (c-di-GMP phosphodiesterase class II)
MLAHLARLAKEKDRLGRELLQWHEQLNRMFELTAHISQLRDPDEIELDLIRRFGTLLAAGAVFLDRAGCCQQIGLDGGAGAAVTAGPDSVRQALAVHVEAVRTTGRTIVPVLSASEAAALANSRVLVAALQGTGCEPGVIIVLRSASERAFEQRDVLAAESVLAHGAQVLSNADMVRHLQQTALETVCTLVNAIDAKDNYTATHSERAGGYARLLGEALGLPPSQLQALEWAGLLHDVGKIGVPELVLNKPGPFTAHEWEQMHQHPQIGHDVLKPVSQIIQVLEAVLLHHENHDGSGYPRGLRGREIPLEARIIHVVDILDALTTVRPYRQAYSFEGAIRLLELGAGRVTDPDLTSVLIETLRRHMAADPQGFRTRFGHAGGDPPTAGARN